MKTCLLFILASCCTLTSIAQNEVDTVGQLDSIMVLAKAIAPLGQPSTIARKDWQTGMLASSPEEALMFLPGVHIRQRGAGQIATLQYRGLQGARIAQTWQGIPVTNPQLGTSDVNELSLALLDKIEIGSPTTLGNPAAVSLSQSATGPTAFTARYSEGKGYFVNAHWNGLRVFYQNDKHYFNHSYGGRDFKTKETRNKTNIIGANYTVNYDHNWSSSTYFIRSIRTFSQFFFDYPVRNELETISARQLFTVRKDSTERFDFGILLDKQDYATYSYTNSKGSTVQALLNNEIQLSKNVRLSTDNRAILSKHTDYSASQFLPETRTVLAYETELSAIEIEATGGFHARLNSGKVVYGSISFQTEISPTERVKVVGRRIGRIPTLDDLLWAQGGDENLKPEKGWEISISSEGKFGSTVITPLIFVRRFSDYILWLPRGNFWSPNSIPAVNNYGAGIVISGRIGSIKNHYFKYQGSVNYSELQLAEDQILSTDVLLLSDENLPFSPRLTGSLNLDYSYGRWSFLSQGRYTGDQLTAYNGLSETEAHAVLRAAISYKFNTSSLSLSCDNLTNTIIPTDFSFYTPLRRFELTFNYTPQTKK